jgi:hypothetical protein
MIVSQTRRTAARLDDGRDPKFDGVRKAFDQQPGSQQSANTHYGSRREFLPGWAIQAAMQSQEHFLFHSGTMVTLVENVSMAGGMLQYPQNIQLRAF